MILTTSSATRRLTAELMRHQMSGSWRTLLVEPGREFEEMPLASYACGCNEHTLLQVQRTGDFDTPVHLVLTCHRDGARLQLPYRRMPWIVEEYMKTSETLVCAQCGDEVAEVQTFDGVVVGLSIPCPICRFEHAIDLTLAALPADLRYSAFGIEPPRAMMSPPVFAVLRMMWECIQRQPSNSFTFVPYTIRDDSGVLRHVTTGVDFEVAIDHLSQLLTGGLIEDGDSISISKPGVIVCLREFGQAAR